MKTPSKFLKSEIEFGEIRTTVPSEFPKSEIQNPKSEIALVLVGHGSTLNPDSSAPIHYHVEELRKRKIFSEVVACFWKEEPSMREVLHMIESPHVYIVPDFISEGYFTQNVIPRELELTGRVTHSKGRILKYADPVGSHPHMTEVILQRAKQLAPDALPAQTSLIIVGHGTGLNENSAKAAKLQAERIRNQNYYAEVLPAYMEEAPNIAQWDTLTSHPTVIVVPFFIADGLHSYQDIPVLLGIEEADAPPASQRQIFRNNPYHLRNKCFYYANSIGTDAGIVDVILDQIRTFEASLGNASLPF